MMKEALPSSALTPVTHLAASLAVAFIIFIALNRSMVDSGTSAGGFVSFITALLLMISPIKQLSNISPILQRGLAACESVFGILDAPNESDTGTSVLAQSQGQLAFNHVSFRYPGAERLALDDVSFTVGSGTTVALVGASGGGKSTLASLISRFYGIDSGSITLDGIDINALTLASLRSHIALVSQDIVLLNDTVHANIAFGLSRNIDAKKVQEAAVAANAWEFIAQLPQGLNTVIGENGSTLSGGQRQRIAIARALLKNAPLLILDEATSALDTESERLVQVALATLMKNRTTLVIAHRLSTIERADQILVLDQGRIVETGTHATLLQANGYYANLSRMQS
jgi:subfamily B ATP-binding cassette protein MsbA